MKNAYLKGLATFQVVLPKEYIDLYKKRFDAKDYNFFSSFDHITLKNGLMIDFSEENGSSFLVESNIIHVTFELRNFDYSVNEKLKHFNSDEEFFNYFKDGYKEIDEFSAIFGLYKNSNDVEFDISLIKYDLWLVPTDGTKINVIEFDITKNTKQVV